MFEDLEDDFMDDDFSDDFEGEEGGAAEEEGGNNFMLIAGVVGGVLLLGTVCLLIYLFAIRPNSTQGAKRADIETQNAIAYAQQTELAISVGQTAEADQWTDTPTATLPPTDTPEPTATEVIVATDTPEVSVDATDDPRTATVAALLTAAAGQPTANTGSQTPVTPIITVITTELPDTGFADDVGLPGLIALAFFAVVIIFLARRMRTVNA